MAALRRVFFNPKNYFSFHPLNSFYRPMMNCTYGHLKIPNQPPRNHAFANLPMIGLLSMSLSMTAILGAMAVTRPSIPTFICELIGPFTLPLTTSFKYLFVGPYSSCSNYQLNLEIFRKSFPKDLVKRLSQDCFQATPKATFPSFSPSLFKCSPSFLSQSLTPVCKSPLVIRVQSRNGTLLQAKVPD